MARRRYVPKTYNNRRFLRILTTGIITLALSFVILFIILFFIFQQFEVDGVLLIPGLMDDIMPPESENVLPPDNDFYFDDGSGNNDFSTPVAPTQPDTTQPATEVDTEGDTDSTSDPEQETGSEDSVG